MRTEPWGGSVRRWGPEAAPRSPSYRCSQTSSTAKRRYGVQTFRIVQVGQGISCSLHLSFTSLINRCLSYTETKVAEERILRPDDPISLLPTRGPARTTLSRSSSVLPPPMAASSSAAPQSRQTPTGHTSGGSGSRVERLRALVNDPTMTGF